MDKGHNEKGVHMNRTEKEKQTLALMIRIYCRKKHRQRGELCGDCNALLEYANKRLDLCRYGNEKGFCNKCTTHCYNKEMRGRIKEVMRFSGPRALLYDPVMFIRHMLDR